MFGFVMKPDFVQRFFRPVNPEISQQRELIIPKLYIVGYFGNAFYFYYMVVHGSWLIVHSKKHSGAKSTEH